jgi:formate C-acetyltransferase
MTEAASNGFIVGNWQENINVHDFIIKNFTPYDAGEDFLMDSSIKTKKLWSKCKKLLRDELLKGGVLNVDTKTVSGIISFPAGYVDEKNEIIKGLQTDRPLKRAIVPYGGVRMARQACEEYGYTLSVKIDEIFDNYRKTHNDGVFSAYTREMKKARKVP